MLFSHFLFALSALTTSIVLADKHHAVHVDARGLSSSSRHSHRQHAHNARSVESSSSSSPKLKKRLAKKKRSCVAKPTGSSDSSTSSGTSSDATVTQSDRHTKTTSASGTTQTTDSSSSSNPTSSSNSPSSGGGSSGLINIQDAACGASGATAQTTLSTGPNGSEDFLNCGINSSGGWNPPNITFDNMIYISLDDALKMSNSPYNECSKYLDTFKTAAAANGIPDIVLAAFALQESSCNPDATGGGGEEGMFQLSSDKCVNQDCKDPTVNTNIAAAFIKSQLAVADNNFLLVIGLYNGWEKGLTKAEATKAKDSSCCRCQNNLDYPHQYLNGWAQGINAYTETLGTYQNLASCPNDGANGRKRSRIEAADPVPESPFVKSMAEKRWRF